MTSFPQPSSGFSLPARLALAVALFAGGFAFRLAVLPVDGGFPFVTFYPVMTLGFMLCGAGPGLLVAGLCAAAGGLVFSPPAPGLAHGQATLVATSVFLFATVPVGVMLARLANARRALADQAHRQTAILQTHTVAIATTRGPNVVWANPGLERLLGYGPGEIDGVPMRLAYADEEAYRAIRDAAIPALERDGAFRADVQMRRKDGSLIWVNLSGSTLPGQDRAEAEYVWLFVDADRRKRAEAELITSRRFLERTGQIAGVGGWQMDLADTADTQVMWTDETCRLHDCPPGYRPTLEQALDFYTPTSRPLIEAAVRACMDDGTPFDLEVELVSAKGRPFWARAAGDAEREDGRVVRVLGAFQDITQRRRAALALEESETRLQMALVSGNIGIWEIDFSRRAIWYGRRTAEMTDNLLPVETWVPLDGPEMAAWALRIQPDTRQVRADAIDRLYRGLSSNVSITYSTTLEHGRQVWFAMQGVGMDRDAKTGTFGRALGVVQDITEQELARRRLRAQEDQARRQAALLKTVYETAKVGLSFVDRNLRIVEINAYVAELFGRSIDECLGKTRGELGNSNSDYVEGLMRQVLQTGQPVEGHEFSAAPTCDPTRKRDWLMSLYPVFGSDGEMLGVGQALLEITAQKRLEQALVAANKELRDLAHTDALTSLANRRRFDESLARACAAATRRESEVSLILVDIDRFKAFNDLYGHQAGDSCLRQVARALALSGRRPEDVVARFGGEEFAVLLPGTDEDGAFHVASLAQRAVQDLQIPHADNLLCGGIVTASFGVATLPCTGSGGGAAASELLAAADSMLYAAKRDGRNRVRAVRVGVGVGVGVGVAPLTQPARIA